jgi:3-hydroxybutyryl-CoA dehydrogenase
MNIRKITVIGAGTMGRGIAYVACTGGFETTLQDISEDMLKKSKSTMQENLRKAVERKLMSPEDAEKAIARLTLTRELSAAVRSADFIIEAIPEIIEAKLELFSKIDKICADEVVLSSNTSALSITEMAGVTTRSARFVGMHFFNPVHKMKLVEIIRGLETTDDAIEITKAVATKMGKETVTIKESPGFITSRLNALIGNEAFYMLQEGITSAEEIDKAIKLGLNHPMGPFEMVDMVGLDTRLSILKFLHQTLGEKYRPCPLMEQYVKAGRLGKKVGRGVYDYEK